MKVGDRILGPPRGTSGQARSWIGTHGPDQSGPMLEAKDYVMEVYRLAPLVGIDPAIVVAQSAHETDNWRSAPWRDWLNPGGLGITFKGQDPGYRWANGTDAARAHIGHLLVYLGAWGWLGDNGVAEEALGIDRPFSIYDPRFSAVTNSHLAGTVHTIDDLTGKWATDPKYAAGIVAKAAAIFPNLPDQEVTFPMPTGKPTIVLDAGHRSTDRSGNPAEMSMTDDLARAYRTELRRRGFEAFWYQEDLDRDSDPDETIGDLNTVAKGLGAWLKTQPWALMLSLHYNGAHSPLHAIVPDNVGLSTAYPEGRDPADTAANNLLDVRLGWEIMDDMSHQGLGTLFRGKLAQSGVMSETETGVGLQGFRLAVFAATAPSRNTAVRLVIEHGGTSDPAGQHSTDFARAAADAIEAVYGKASTASTTTTTAAPDLWPGMSEGVAAKLFNPSGLKKPDGGAIGFSVSGELGGYWVRHGIASLPPGEPWWKGDWPALLNVFRRGDGRIVYQFATFVYEQGA